jgi:hypothetical protein
MSARPRETRIPIGPLVAAIGGILLVVSLFLDWYEGLTGFTVFEVLDLLLFALGVSTLFALAEALGVVRGPARPMLSLILALLALLVVLSQVVNDPPAAAGPGGPEQDTGIWLALAGSALMVAGAILSSARIAIAVSPRADEPRTVRDAPPPARDEAPTVRDEPSRP